MSSRWKNGLALAIIFAFVFAMAILLAASVSGQTPLTGRASVIDGDTIEVKGKRVRLWGIDAPESAQWCEDSAGIQYRCGKEAAFGLDEYLTGRVVFCQQKDIDRYKRLVAVCRVGRVDLNGWLVENGYAVAYISNHTYRRREALAKSKKLGIHAGRFVPPWDWRKGVR